MKRRNFFFALAPLPLAMNAIASAALTEKKTVQSPQSYSSMWTYLWDFADEGYDTVLAKIRDTGINAVSVAAAYHAGKFLYPHNPKRKIFFPEDGTIYFSPDLTGYGRIKPFVNSLVGEGHSIAALRERAEKFGLNVHAWIVCCHNSALGMKYPDLTSVTAFGDTLPQNLCPNNPDVRAYLSAVVRDAARQGVSVIELEALQFQGYSHGFHHEREGIVLNAGMKALLGFCFCPSCFAQAKEASIDLLAIREYAIQKLTACFDHPDSEESRQFSYNNLPADLFTPFFDWRNTSIYSLVGELLKQVNGTKVLLRPMMTPDPAMQKLVGISPSRIAALTGGVLTLGYVKDGKALESLLYPFINSVNNAEVTVGFQVGLPESGGKAEFISRMESARMLGISRFNFYNYGLIPLERLEWIKEALI